MVPFLMVVLVFWPGRYPHFDLDLLGAEAEPTTAPKKLFWGMAVLLLVVLVFCPSRYPHFYLRLYALLDHTASPMVKI